MDSFDSNPLEEICKLRALRFRWCTAEGDPIRNRPPFAYREEHDFEPPDQENAYQLHAVIDGAGLVAVNTAPNAAPDTLTIGGYSIYRNPDSNSVMGPVEVLLATFQGGALEVEETSNTAGIAEATHEHLRQAQREVPMTTTDSPKEAGSYGSTDLSTTNRVQFMAGLFIKMHRNRFRYVVDSKGKSGVWYVCDRNGYWSPDTRATITKAIEETRDKYLLQSIKADDRELRARATSLDSVTGRRNLLYFAEHDPRVRAEVEDFNTHTHLLPTEDGVYDLDVEGGHLAPRPARADEMVSWVAPASPEAEHNGDFHRFVEQVLPDRETREYVQKALGQALLGRVTERIFLVFHGHGNNGKSTLVEACEAALGPYAVAPKNDLIEPTKYGPRDETLYLLRFARLAVVRETKKRTGLDVARVKTLTGGDRLSGRLLYQNPVYWDPTHLLILHTNHVPMGDPDERALWNRIRVVEFTQTFTDASDDNNLLSRLKKNNSGEALRWLLDGFGMYVADGGKLPTPESVREASERARLECDPTTMFLQEMTVEDPDSYVLADAMQPEWAAWCEQHPEQAVSYRQFAARMVTLGYMSERRRVTDAEGARRQKAVYPGLRLRDANEAGDKVSAPIGGYADVISRIGEVT